MGRDCEEEATEDEPMSGVIKAMPQTKAALVAIFDATDTCPVAAHLWAKIVKTPDLANSYEIIERKMAFIQEKEKVIPKKAEEEETHD